MGGPKCQSIAVSMSASARPAESRIRPDSSSSAATKRSIDRFHLVVSPEFHRGFSSVFPGEELISTFILVRLRGLEPPPLTGQAPQACAATNYATDALRLFSTVQGQISSRRSIGGVGWIRTNVSCRKLLYRQPVSATHPRLHETDLDKRRRRVLSSTRIQARIRTENSSFTVRITNAKRSIPFQSKLEH